MRTFCTFLQLPQKERGSPVDPVVAWTSTCIVGSASTKMSRGRCLLASADDQTLIRHQPHCAHCPRGITAPWVPMVNWLVAARTFVRTDRLLRLASMSRRTPGAAAPCRWGTPICDRPPRVRRLVDHDLWNLLTVEVGDTGLDRNTAL